MENAQIAQMIKNVCKQKNCSVTKLLIECGIRKSLIYDLEKRDYTPSAAIVEKIANYLDCSVDYLLQRTINPNSHKSTNENIKIDNITDNHGLIGNNHANVTINNAEPNKNQKEALLKAYEEMKPIQQAKLLVYADKLLKEE